MKYFLVSLIGLGLISSCNLQEKSNTDTQKLANNVNCPEPSTELNTIRIDRKEYGFYDAFNYQIKNIVANNDTITFQSFDRQFTFCRGNNNWAIAPFKKQQFDTNNNTIQLNEQNYKYAVKLSGDRVIFELITPNSTQPQQQQLYDLEQTKQAQAGVELGEPEISTAMVYGDRIFWSIFTYHGEGFGGIATIVSYDPASKKITVIQPPEIAAQIINDLVIAGTPDNPTFWLATQLTSEGNPYLPSMGLVAYHPNNPDYTKGTIDSYRVDNSPIVGAIPTKLYLEQDILWIETGNGICQLKWQNIDNNSWSCWQFALMANIPSEGLPVYSSLLDNTVDGTMTETTVEVLWWLVKQREPVSGRYEIRYQPAMTVELTDRGAMSWNEYYYGDFEPPVLQPPLYWAGSNWHWEGDRFVRGLDEVALNLVGGGVMGIGSQQTNDDYIFDLNAVRGDLELLELTKDKTKVKYYSAWAEDSLLQPYLTIVPHQRSPQSQPNPLLSQ
jgi:hypothetical protein